jgi:hypothetical protein
LYWTFLTWGINSTEKILSCGRCQSRSYSVNFPEFKKKKKGKEKKEKKTENKRKEGKKIVKERKRINCVQNIL